MRKLFILFSFLIMFALVGCALKDPGAQYDLAPSPGFRMHDKDILSGATLADLDSLLVEDDSTANATKYTTLANLAAYLYADNVTSDLQAQLDDRCLESVLGTSIGAGLLLDSTVLKASTILQKYHGVDPATDVLDMLASANDTAILNNIGDGIVTLADTTLADADYLWFWDYSDNGTTKRVDANKLRNVPASTTLAGEIELATSGEMNTGNATDRANTPDALAGSIFGQKDIGWTIYDSDANSTVADGKEAYTYPYPDSPALELLSVTCGVKDLNGATGGATTFMVRRVRDGSAVDMLSVGVTISHNEYSAWDGTVDDNNKLLERGDLIYIDINSITSGHPQKGPSCTLLIGRPQ